MTAAPGAVLWLASNCPRWAGDDSAPFILALASDLGALGWEIVLLAPHAPGLPRREMLAGVRIERFRYAWPDSAQTLCYGAGVLANLRGHRRRALLVPLLVAAQWRAAAALLHRERFALVHAHWLLPQGFTAERAIGRDGPPLLVTAHGGDLFALRGAASRAAKRRVVTRAAAVTVNSSATERAALALGAAPERLHRIPMGATEPAPAGGTPSPLRAALRRGAGPLLAFVGRLVPEKGVGDLLEAVAALRTALPDVGAVVVGSGPSREAFEADARRLGIAGRVHFAGAVPPAQVHDYLAAADIYVGPSRRSPDGWVEAQGISYVEAMLAGLPVVATDSGGIADLVRDGETGLLVPERAPAAIAAAVTRLAGDAAFAVRLAAAGREFARRHYTRAVSAAAFDRLYRDVLSRDAASTRSKK